LAWGGLAGHIDGDVGREDFVGVGVVDAVCAYKVVRVRDLGGFRRGCLGGFRGFDGLESGFGLAVVGGFMGGGAELGLLALAGPFEGLMAVDADGVHWWKAYRGNAYRSMRIASFGTD
jgi:hypothetical protein